LIATIENKSLPVSPATHVAFLCVLGLAAILAYSNNFTAEFVYDDYPFILENPAVRSLSDAHRFFFDREMFSQKGQYIIYRPLATLSFALNHKLSGYEPAPFHAVNIMLHAGCGLVLYLLIFETVKNAVFAFLVSLLFLVHPVQTEAVAWVSGRGNSMFLLFLLVSVVWYRRWSSGAAARGLSYGLALLFAALSLLSKEMAVILPGLLLVYDASLNRPGGDEGWKRRFVAVVPFLALSCAYLVLRHLVLGETRQIGYWGGGPGTALLTMIKGFVYYVRLMVVPAPLTVEYIMPIAKSLFQPSVFLCFLILSLILLICIFSYRRTPVVFFGIAWFFVSLLPVSNIVPLKAIINERFLYLPSIGFCVILASPLLMGRAVTEKRLMHGMVGALLVTALLYTSLTFDRNRDWRDSLALWTASVNSSPSGPTSRYNLGVELYRRGRYDEAVEHLKIACALRKRYPFAHGALGNVYMAQGKYDHAIQEYEIGFKQAPDDDRFRENLAAAWSEKGKRHVERGEVGMAVQSFLRVLSYEPDSAGARDALRQLRDGAETKDFSEF
jgi:hypothetical protein